MKVNEIGNLTADPVYGEKDDLKYCNFTIAINDQYDKDKVEYVRVSAYDKRAEACRDYLKKGSQISVEGTVKANGYIDKNGKPRASLNINADDVKFLSRTKQHGNPQPDSEIDTAMQKAEHNKSVPPQSQTVAQSR